MKYGSIPGVEKPVSRLIQGAGRARAGGDDEKGFAVLDALLAKGCTTFDTARVYGTVDSFLGAWINSRGIRDKVVILAKGAHHNSERQRVTPEDIRADLEDALRDLGTDHVELYVLHRDDPSVPVGPVIETLNTLVKEGKIQAFGGSNWTTTRLEEANRYAADNGFIPFALSNPNYSLAEQIEEPWENCISISGPQGESERAWYEKNKMPVFCWSSLAGGFWTGNFTRENQAETAEKFKLVSRCYCTESNFQRLDRVRELASKKGASVPQIALAFLMNQPLDVYALVGCVTADEFQNNIDALDISLTPKECDWLDLRVDTPE
jgi:aryl-alcohol dehydrogenase-like predicted oxidoreductase